VAVVCLVLAMALSFGLLPKMYESKNEEVYIIIASKDIEAGTVIDDSMIKFTVISKSYNYVNYYENKEDVIGKACMENIYEGELLDKRHFGLQTVENSTDEKEIPEGMCMVSIKLPDEAAGVTGYLRGNSIVDVFEVKKDDEGKYVSQLKVKGIYVEDVLNRNMQSLSNLDRLKNTSDDIKDSDFEPYYVVFICSKEVASELARLEEAQSLHLIFTKKGESI